MTARHVSRGVVGVFADTHALLDALKRARAHGMDTREVYSPVALEGIDEFLLPGRSPVRLATLIGGVSGLAAGLALAIWSALQWNLMVAGKPVVSIVPFLVVGFEFTILLGALTTLVALLVLMHLPTFRFPSAGYRPDFSNDRFGVWLDSAPENTAAVSRLLRDAGALDIKVLNEKSAAEVLL
jgi:hypothetical protein